MASAVLISVFTTSRVIKVKISLSVAADCQQRTGGGGESIINIK